MNCTYYIIISETVGLKYNTIWKNLDNKVYTEGLHAGPPGFTFIIFPNTYTTLTYSKLRVSIIIKLEPQILYIYKETCNSLISHLKEI